jgi:hypothetical protein
MLSLILLLPEKTLECTTVLCITVLEVVGIVQVMSPCNVSYNMFYNGFCFEKFYHLFLNLNNIRTDKKDSIFVVLEGGGGFLLLIYIISVYIIIIFLFS